MLDTLKNRMEVLSACDYNQAAFHFLTNSVDDFRVLFVFVSGAETLRNKKGFPRHNKRTTQHVINIKARPMFPFSLLLLTSNFSQCWLTTRDNAGYAI